MKVINYKIITKISFNFSLSNLQLVIKTILIYIFIKQGEVLYLFWMQINEYYIFTICYIGPLNEFLMQIIFIIISFP